jgi:hypothetical protein
MERKTDDKLDPKAKGKKTGTADFDRNRDGLYGGLLETRDTRRPGRRPSTLIRRADHACPQESP